MSETSVSLHSSRAARPHEIIKVRAISGPAFQPERLEGHLATVNFRVHSLRIGGMEAIQGMCELEVDQLNEWIKLGHVRPPVCQAGMEVSVLVENVSMTELFFATVLLGPVV